MLTYYRRSVPEVEPIIGVIIKGRSVGQIDILRQVRIRVVTVS